jgi:Flp pilus assembly protein TadD
MANSQSDQAIEQLKAALELDKVNVDALTDLGLIAMDRSEWKTAEGYWLQLVQLLGSAEMSSQDQRLADVYYYLGTTFVEEQRYEEAVANLKQSIFIKRDSSPVHYTLSVAYQRLGIPDMQRQELGIVLAFDPRHAQANYDLGMLELAAGDVASAAESFRISADNAPAGITAPQDQLAKLGSASEYLATAQRLKTSDPKKALTAARIAAALDPTNADAVGLVATLWEKNGDKTRARNAWQRLLELVPGDSTATEAIKRLGAATK